MSIISRSRWPSSCIEHAQIICLPIYLPWSHSATLLKAAPLSTKHLQESVLFLAHVFSSTSGHLLVFTVSNQCIWNSLPPCVRNSPNETLLHSRAENLPL